MKILIHILMVFIVFAIITFSVTVIKFIYHHRYGKAVFKISSNKFRKSSISKKEYNMNVEPFKDQFENVYLPLKYVVYSLGGSFYFSEGYKLAIKILDKDIKINNKNSILVKSKSLGSFYRIENKIKIVNDEIMLSHKYIKDIFGVTVDLNKDTGEIILR